MKTIEQREAEEAAWSAGYRAACKRQLEEALHKLGYDGSEAQHTQWVAEREEAIMVLRRICAEHGDTNWEPSLNLGDILSKHLEKHLHA